MSDKLIVRHCSPTLAGLKTGNIFTCEYINLKTLKNDLIKWNKNLNSKGVYLMVLRVKNQKAMIYIYREKILKEELGKENIKEFLIEYGYNKFTIEACTTFLSYKLQKSEIFPHEIGVFLGYPLEDIRAFIKNDGDNSKCVGCWKVYTDVEAALSKFEKFNKCKKIYWRKLLQGTEVSKLAVAI